MAFIGEHERVVGQVFEQGRRRFAGLAAGEIARIVLDAGAGAGGFQHLDVEHRALLKPLRFQKTAGVVEFGQPLLQFALDGVDGLNQRRPRRHVMRIRVDFHEFQILRFLAGERIELGDGFDFVAKETDAPRAVLVVRREQFHRVAAHAEHAARKVAAAAFVLQRHEVGDQLPHVDAFADLYREGHGGVGLDRADAVDARHGGDDDDVVALQQRARRRVAHAVDLLVDGGFLLDIRVGPRHVGLGLIVVVVGYEIFDGVVGKEALELAVKLRREGLVGREDQRGAVGLLDDLRHRECLAGAGDAQQHLIAFQRVDALDQFRDGARLVALGLVFRNDLEFDAALGFLWPGRAMRRPRLGGAQVGIASLQQRLQRIGGGAGAGEALVARPRAPGGVGRQGDVKRLRQRRVEAGHVAGVERGLRRLAKTPRFVQRRVQQRGEMFVERLNVGTRRFRARRADGGLARGGSGRLGHPGNMGRVPRRGKAGARVRAPSRQPARDT